MYGGNGGHGNGDSINDGSLVTVDQTTAAVTLVGHPGGACPGPTCIKRLSGLAFDSTGALYASTLTGGGFPPPPPALTSTLIRLNPDTGALLATIGPITDGPGGPAIGIADLAVQPCTDVLFGIRAPVDGLGGEGNLYTIDKATGVATLVGKTGDFFASIAFGPDGTLYESGARLDVPGNFLRTLNPANAAIQSSVPTAHGFGALGVRPTDGEIFGGTGDSGNIYTIDPVTGSESFVGNTGQNFVGDLDFRPSGPGPGGELTCLSPAEVWIGLKNSDDVGTKFDLKAEVIYNGNVVGTGELDSVPGGSSGFNNAHLQAISLALSTVSFGTASDTLCIRLSVRIATKVTGHRSGTARLWYNDSAADSRFDAKINGVDRNYYLVNGFQLSTAPGPGPKKTADVFVDKLVNGNAWKPFGTWCTTVD
jgi:hypothetical protein